MGNLTRHLSRSEFACQCGCGFDTVDFQLVQQLQDCVDRFEFIGGESVKIIITSGNRCAEHNASVGGAENSQHINGRAADFKLFWRASGEQIAPEKVANHFDAAFRQCGLGRYDNRTHFDTRGNSSRWDAR